QMRRFVNLTPTCLSGFRIFPITLHLPISPYSQLKPLFFVQGPISRYICKKNTADKILHVTTVCTVSATAKTADHYCRFPKRHLPKEHSRYEYKRPYRLFIILCGSRGI